MVDGLCEIWWQNPKELVEKEKNAGNCFFFIFILALCSLVATLVGNASLASMKTKKSPLTQVLFVFVSIFILFLLTLFLGPFSRTLGFIVLLVIVNRSVLVRICVLAQFVLQQQDVVHRLAQNCCFRVCVLCTPEKKKKEDTVSFLYTK